MSFCGGYRIGKSAIVQIINEMTESMKNMSEENKKYFQKHIDLLSNNLGVPIYFGVWFTEECLPDAGKRSDAFKEKSGIEAWFNKRMTQCSADKTIMLTVRGFYIGKKIIMLEMNSDFDSKFLGALSNPEELSTFAVKTTIYNNPRSGFTKIDFKTPLNIPATPYTYEM